MVDSKKQWKAWLYLAPAIVLLLIFTVWPIINTFRLAFLEKYNEMEAIRGVTFKFGLANFKFVLQWKWFMSALKNTMLLTVVTVPISTILALLIAVALNSIGPLKRLLQTIFFLPYVTNSIAIGMVFAAMFNIIGYQGLGDPNMHVEIGIINKLLGLFGVEPINWINPGSSWAANFTVMVIYIVFQNPHFTGRFAEHKQAILRRGEG